MTRHLLCSLLLVGAACAQQTTFTSRSELVLVPVTVTSHGKHLAGLTKQDFRVHDEGQPRDVAFLEEVTAATAAPVQRAKLPLLTYTNQPVAAGPGRLTVFLLDLYNTPLVYQENARRQLIQYLETHGLSGGPLLLTILRYDGLQVALNYADTPEQLIRLLRSVKSGSPRIGDENFAVPMSRSASPRSPMEDISNDALLEIGNPNVLSSSAFGEVGQRYRTRLLVERMAVTYEALIQLSNSLAGIPGRKTLIWASGSVPYLPSMPGTLSGFGDAVNLRLRVLGALSAANMAVYPVEVSQPDNPAWTGPSSSMPQRVRFPMALGGVEQIQAAMDFADNTGGKVCTYSNHLDSCFQKAVDDSASYYLLAYYAARSRPGWHKIKVFVDRSGTKVRARHGYLQPDPSKESRSMRAQLSMALASPLDFTTLPVTFQWKAASGGRTSMRVPFEISLDAKDLELDSADSNHFKFDVLVLAFEAVTSKRAAVLFQTIDAHPPDASLDQIRTGGIHYNNQVDLAPGKYTVRVLIRDALSGRVGTLTVPLSL
jgi:VWFA-related protein